jgi:hypothetical protein
MDVVMKKKFSAGLNFSKRRIPGLQHAFPVQNCHENLVITEGGFIMWN